jgi:hypothetical protein
MRVIKNFLFIAIFISLWILDLDDILILNLMELISYKMK